MELKGIDVSVHQGKIDWRRVSEAGIVFAFIRVGYAGYQGEIHEDTRYRENMEGAKKAGIKTGVYVYSYVKTVQAAKIAAQQVLELVRPYDPPYPIAFDLEEEMYNGFSRSENTALVREFITVIREGGYEPMLYTYLSFANCLLNMDELEPCALWIAHFDVPVCGYQKSYDVWQWTGKGSVDGVSTLVDCDISYRDLAEGRQERQKGNMNK